MTAARHKELVYVGPSGELLSEARRTRLTRAISTVLKTLSPPTLATQTSAATSILLVGAILAVVVASLHSFRSQLMSVMIAEQNTLVERIADNVDQRLLGLQRALAVSAKEITEADLASSDAAQRYLDTNTGLYAAFDRSIFLFSAEGKLLAERPFIGSALLTIFRA